MTKKQITLSACIGLPMIIVSVVVSFLIWPRVSFTGTVVSVTGDLLLIEVIDSRIDNGMYYVSAIEETVIMDSSLTKISVSEIEIGSLVKITFDGYIYESNPSIVRTCYRIRVIDN